MSRRCVSSGHARRVLRRLSNEAPGSLASRASSPLGLIIARALDHPTQVPESDPLWKKALPDMAPATNNSTHTHHLQLAARKSSLSRVDSSSDKQMRLRRSLSTVVRSVPSSPGETPPFQTHSSLASAEGRPRNLAPSSSFWANPPRAQQGDGRPALSRATTWRTSAPRLAHEDSKEDLDV